MKLILKICLLFLLLKSNFLPGQNFTEILGRPTDASVTASILFDRNVDLFIEYGTQSGVYSGSTGQISNVSGIPDEIDLQNLIPDSRYYYRTRYRLTGTGSFLAGTEHSFHTQRAVGSTFTFTVESDEHLNDKKGVPNMYRITLANQAKDMPDFMLDLGDNFGDDHNPFTITSVQLDSLHKVYRPYYGSICHSIPLFLCLGNHEGEKDYYLHQTPPNNMAVYGTLWRKFYYPNPYPNNFYTGDTVHEGYGMGQPENYYAWNWGNALFVVMDVYRYDCDTSAKPQKWNWSLGFPEYTWLKKTLESSTAQYKFVFAHHVSGEGRGGIVQAHYYEWGGYDGNGNYLFATKRPGWAKPIHQLFVDNGVNIFFQGHDHLFAHEVMDGVTYQEVPMPSDSTYEIGMLANAGAYTSDTLNGTGHIRVTVSPSCVKVDYVRAYLPADTISGVHHNREVAFSYTIGNCANGINDMRNEEESVKIFPNPAGKRLQVVFITPSANKHVMLMNAQKQIIMETSAEEMDVSRLSPGIYILSIKTPELNIFRKVLVQH